jgi:hypothetical protein
MTIVKTRQARRDARSAGPPVVEARLPVCAFCRRDGTEVPLHISDAANLYGVCENCIDECAKVIACSCVC